MHIYRRKLLSIIFKEEINHTFVIISENSYVGKYFYCTAKYDDNTVYGTWSIISGSSYASINSNGKVTINEGVQNKDITIQVTYTLDGETLTASQTINISYDNQLSIESDYQMSGTSGNVIGRYNSTIVTPAWSIISGNSLATIDANGHITILGSGTITVQAVYSGYTTTKTIELVYDAGTTSQTEVNDDGSITTTTTTTTTDPQTGTTTETTTTTVTNEDGSQSNINSQTVTNSDGSSSTSSNTTNSDGSSSTSTSTTTAPDENGSVTTETSSTTTNADGSSSATESTVTENEDGSSQSSSTTVNYDENGDTTGSTSNETTNNADGSSSSSTTNYNSEGDPTDQQNVDTDTSGNVNTQDVEYNQNGDPVVVGYTIDTSGNEDGTGEEMSGTGVNTEFVPFQHLEEGFIIHIKYRFVLSEQPIPPIVPDTEDTSTNYLYNVFSAKATMKVQGKWPGFDIRATRPKSGGSGGQYQMRYQLATGNQTAVTLSASTHTCDTNIYDLTFIYDPNANYKFTVNYLDKNGNTQLLSRSTTRLLDSSQLLNIDLTIGYALDSNNNPIRYSNTTIYDFSVTRLNV